MLLEDLSSDGRLFGLLALDVIEHLGRQIRRLNAGMEEEQMRATSADVHASAAVVALILRLAEPGQRQRLAPSISELWLDSCALRSRPVPLCGGLLMLDAAHVLATSEAVVAERIVENVDHHSSRTRFQATDALVFVADHLDRFADCLVAKAAANLRVRHAGDEDSALLALCAVQSARARREALETLLSVVPHEPLPRLRLSGEMGWAPIHQGSQVGMMALQHLAFLQAADRKTWSEASRTGLGAGRRMFDLRQDSLIDIERVPIACLMERLRNSPLWGLTPVSRD